MLLLLLVSFIPPEDGIKHNEFDAAIVCDIVHAGFVQSTNIYFLTYFPPTDEYVAVDCLKYDNSNIKHMPKPVQTPEGWVLFFYDKDMYRVHRGLRRILVKYYDPKVKTLSDGTYSFFPGRKSELERIYGNDLFITLERDIEWEL